MNTLNSKLRLSVLALCLITLTLIPAIPRSAHANPGIFKITLMVPASNPARQSWSLVVQADLSSLGIDAGRVVLDFGTVLNRAFTPSPDILGKTYDNGGYDAVFIGQALGIDPDPWSFYHSSQFAPTGGNYQLWNDTTNDQLTNQIKTTLDQTQRLNLVKQWQQYAFDQQPAATILYTQEIVPFDNTMTNGAKVWSAYHFPTWPPVEQLSTTVANASIILAQTGPAPDQGFIPELSSSYYDSTVWSTIFSNLAQRNDTVVRTMLPALATDWSVASDNKTWTVNLRQGVTWHDGQPFNATDVKFTFDAMQDDTLAANVESFVKSLVGGKNNVTITGPYQVKFSLPQPYAYFVQNILGPAVNSIPILPAHILKNIPYTSWKTSSFNTGQGGPGPVGTGPYKWVGYDPVTATNHVTRNDNYFNFPTNGQAALKSRGAFMVKDFYVRYILGSDAAITALTTHAVNVLDSQYHLETQQSFLSTWGTSGYVVYDAYGAQELGFNMKHPVFGTGTATPLGQADPTKAALAAKYVRQAISYAIPRQLIIDQLLNGYGHAGITTPVVGNYVTGAATTYGFNTALAPYAFNLTKSRQLLQQAGYFPTTPTTPSFWDSYGLYITGALIAAVVALSAVYVLRVRRKPLPPPSTSSQPSTTSSPTP
jgi:ABC-type transport system substrate-binding protein